MQNTMSTMLKSKSIGGSQSIDNVLFGLINGNSLYFGIEEYIKPHCNYYTLSSITRSNNVILFFPFFKGSFSLKRLFF